MHHDENHARNTMAQIQELYVQKSFPGRSFGWSLLASTFFHSASQSTSPLYASSSGGKSDWKSSVVLCKRVDLQTFKFRCGTNEAEDATSKNAIKREYMLKFICNGNKTQWQQQRSVFCSSSLKLATTSSITCTCRVQKIRTPSKSQRSIFTPSDSKSHKSKDLL